MDNQEAADRLEAVVEMINRSLNTYSPLILLQIKAVATGSDDLDSTTLLKMKKLEHIICSCDASIKVNPGGPASVGVVFQIPGQKNMELAQGSPAKSNNQAEYDAIYFALT